VSRPRVSESPQRAIERFVRRVQARQGVVALVVAGALVAVLIAVVWSILRRVGPDAALGALVAGALVWAAAVAWVVVRAWPSVQSLDARAHLGEALATYWPLRHQRDDAMHAWLASDLAARLVVAPAPPARRRGARRALRLLLPLLPLLLLLLLLLWILPGGLGTGSRAGLGGAPSEVDGGRQGASGRDEATGSGRGRDGDAAVPSPPPDQPPATEPEGGGAAEVARAIDLPVREEFVLPSFIGEGPSRQAKARQGELEVLPGPQGSSAGGGVTDPSALPEQEFARAVERAATARHVPPFERPIVQRYFEALAERR
jgi:hypothetical protein